MKRWTSSWAALALGAALVAVPTATTAQTPSPTATPETRQASPATETAEMQADARQHLAAAETALGRISSTAVTGDAQARIGELRSHVANLRDVVDKTEAGTGAPSWSSEVAEIDRIVAALLSESPTTGAAGTTASQPTGTSGRVTTNKAEEAVALDAATRARLVEVRDAVTAFAAAMNRDARAAVSTPADTSTASTPSASPTPATSADTEASKRALTAARDTLADLTRLPAAAQLSGEPRTQVQQLIADFNDLITASSNWRAAYAKVDANLDSLIGRQTADESATPVAETAGSVGAAGAATGSLDPTIEAKLFEFRTHLKDFERAAGAASPKVPAASPTPAAAAAPAGSEAATDTTAARQQVEAIDAILNGANATSLTADQIEALKVHVAELKRILAGSR